MDKKRKINKDKNNLNEDNLNRKKKKFNFDDDFIPLTSINSPKLESNDQNSIIFNFSKLRPNNSSTNNNSPSKNNSSNKNNSPNKNNSSTNHSSNSSVIEINRINKIKTNKSNDINKLSEKLKNHLLNQNNDDQDKNTVILDDSDDDNQKNESINNSLTNKDDTAYNSASSVDLNDLGNYSDLNNLPGYNDFRKEDPFKNDNSSLSSYCEVIDDSDSNEENLNGKFDKNHGCIDLNININQNNKFTKITSLTKQKFSIPPNEVELFHKHLLTPIKQERKSKTTIKSNYKATKNITNNTIQKHQLMNSIDLFINNNSKPSLKKRNQFNPIDFDEFDIDQSDYHHPWFKKDKNYKLGVLGLHEEINDFYEYSKLKPEEIKVRNLVFCKVKDVIINKYPQAQVYLFGSFLSGLSLPTADLDLVVFLEAKKIPYYLLEQYLIWSGITKADSTKVITKATVPIIKFIHTDSGINVDISFNCADGPRAIDYLKKYIRKYPELPKLLLIIKLFLNQRKLNFAYTGGLSSYSITLMLISFFQQHPRLKSNEESNLNLGVLLMEFFELFGITFNYKILGIRIKSNNGFVRKSSLKCINLQDTSKARLAIEDPLDETNNPSKNSYLFEDIRKSFRNAYYHLNLCCRCPDPNEFKFKRSSKLNHKNVYKSLLSDLIGYSTFEINLRNKILDYHHKQFDDKLNDKKSKNKFDYNSDYIPISVYISSEPITNEELNDEYEQRDEYNSY